MVLKAALISSKTSTETSPPSEADFKSFVSLTRAVSVLWPALDPNESPPKKPKTDKPLL